jgi:hypothetical protein
MKGVWERMESTTGLEGTLLLLLGSTVTSGHIRARVGQILVGSTGEGGEVVIEDC